MPGCLLVCYVVSRKFSSLSLVLPTPWPQVLIAESFGGKDEPVDTLLQARAARPLALALALQRGTSLRMAAGITYPGGCALIACRAASFATGGPPAGQRRSRS